jgi:hypothetical protein
MFWVGWRVLCDRGKGKMDGLGVRRLISTHWYSSGWVVGNSSSSSGGGSME